MKRVLIAKRFEIFVLAPEPAHFVTLLTHDK